MASALLVSTSIYSQKCTLIDHKSREEKSTWIKKCSNNFIKYGYYDPIEDKEIKIICNNIYNSSWCKEKKYLLFKHNTSSPTRYFITEKKKMSKKSKSKNK